ncbi:ABC transporter permease [Candidatus Formimonas warabiya]|uniref:ABC transporter permease n=1 Tax=Formimonas warabiya TaxID=1761012 RepID=A0A3G1KZE6_FORW1|nr:ABC transporter permease [Candidatus Formimonas warabiya]ATW27790.1 hypothetical protein DCMF_26255 [Candidatus Formimonas warabiya]
MHLLIKPVRDKLIDKKSQVLLCVILITLSGILSLTSPFFWQWDNIRNVLDQSTLNIITGVGMTFVIASGGIDLSIGSIAALTGILMAIFLKMQVPVFFAVLGGMVLGTCAGVVNGTLVSFFRINPFIVTLATMSVFRGITLILSGGIPMYSFSSSFTRLGSGSLLNLPVPVLITGMLVLAGAFCLALTKLGYYALALGGNEEALRRSGVPIGWYKTAVYGISGFTAAWAGLILTARLNSADPLAGYMMELDTIATVVLGGASIKGGQGSMAGTVVAGLLLAVLRNGLTINGISSYYQQLVVGLIILLAVIFSERRKKA